MKMATSESSKDLIVVSQARYESTNYVMKQDRYERVRPIIIANWELFETEGGYMMPQCDRIKADADLIEDTLQRKFGKLEFVECYNLQREKLMEILKSEAKNIPTKGTKRPDILLCFIIARGKASFFYDYRKSSKSEKIYFKEVIDIFHGKSCNGLVLRPKLFFIQTEGKAKKKVPAGNFKKVMKEDQEKKIPTIPVEADIFVYASTALTESLDEKLSSFIKFVCEGLDAESTIDVMDLTMKVNKQIFNYTKDPVHIPLCTSQLTKTLML